jgi:hypothetical protein
MLPEWGAVLSLNTHGDPTSPMSQGRENVRAADVTADPPSDAPTQQISLAAVGDRCANCGNPLVSDQRYCINCGERRGQPRFTLADPMEQQTEVVRGAASRPPRRPRTSASLNLIAGVATLLLAMGVGVLIGHNNSSAGSKVANSGPTVIRLDTNAATTPAASSARTATQASHSSAKSKGHKPAKAAAAKPTKVVVQQAAAAASKVVGGSANVAAPTVSQGQSCAAGSAGCQNGKFTGQNFFGGG